MITRAETQRIEAVDRLLDGKAGAYDFRRKRVIPQRTPDSAWTRFQGVGEGFVGCDAAGGDLDEEGVDAL